MISIDPALGYAQVRFSNGLGVIRCVTTEHHDRIKALLEELGFGPHINRPPDVPTEDLRQVMQFMSPANVMGSLDPFLSMLMNYNNLEGIISLVRDRSQRWGEDWGRSFSVLVPSVAVQRILDNGYRLRGPMGNLYFYGRVIKTHQKAAERAEWSSQREAAEAEATAQDAEGGAPLANGAAAKAVADAAPGGEEAAPAGGAAESMETNEPREATKRARSPAILGSDRGSSTRPLPVFFRPDSKRPRAYQGRGGGHGRPVAGIGGEEFAWANALTQESGL
jgi:hypothetical protein